MKILETSRLILRRLEPGDLGVWASIYRANSQFIGRCGLLLWCSDGSFE